MTFGLYIPYYFQLHVLHSLNPLRSMASRKTSSRESERVQNRTGGAGLERIRSDDLSTDF